MESKVDVRKAEDRLTGHTPIPSQACNNPVSDVQQSCLRHATIPTQACNNPVSGLPQSCLRHATIPSRACNNPVSDMQQSHLGHATIPSWHATIPSQAPATPFSWYIHSRMLSALKVLTVSTLRGREINILIVLCPDCPCFFFLNTFISEHVSIAVLSEKSFSTEISISL